MARPEFDATLFWSRVNKTDSCWLWTGPQLKGYGKQGSRLAHRIAYQLLAGPISDGLDLDHLCCTPLCVNPNHLEPVTPHENFLRYRARQTHCRNGHEFTFENTHIRSSNGARVCRACAVDHSRRYRERMAAQT